MDDNYISLQEAADLEGVSYHTFYRRIERNPDKFRTRKEKNPDGGNDIIKVSITSLSGKARSAWRERERLRAQIKEESEKSDTDEILEKPWYIDADIDWYINQYKKQYMKAIDLANVIRTYLDYDGPDRTGYAETFAREHLGKDARTLYRYVKSYQEAEAWINIMEKKNPDANYDFYRILCLCRKPKIIGTFPSILPEVKQCIKNIWFNKEFAGNHCSKEMLYVKLKQAAEVNRWKKIPSYQTVVRYVNYLMEDERMKNAHTLAAEGIRDYKNTTMVKAVRNTKTLKVMEMVMGDEHTFDAWCSYRTQQGKLMAIRPKLVAWIDVRSRMIMGDVLCKDGNSDILKESLLKMIYSDPGGVPKYLYIDNGRDYTAKCMTGIPRNVRKGHIDYDFSETEKGFYRSIGVQDEHRAMPYEPWSKGQIERPFRTICDQFTKWFSSYTGTLTGSKTSEKRNKDIKGMLERGELLTIEEFYEKWHQWLTEEYYYHEHGGLKAMGEKYTTPYDCFMNEERYMKAAPPRECATMLMLKEENITVRNVGIHRFGCYYRSEDLCDCIGDKVTIKWDPNDISQIYVFDRNMKKICTAYAQELLGMGDSVSQKALEDHMKMQKQQLKNDRKRLEEARRPFEEMNESYIGFSQATGGIDLMIGHNRKSSRKDNVVAFPDDRAYQQGFRLSDEKKEQQAEKNKYMEQQAQSVLQKLKAIGDE